MAMGSWVLYDAFFNVRYRVVFSYLVMYYGDKVLGHLGGVSPIHFVACSLQEFIWGVHFGWVAVWVLSPDRCSRQPRTCDCWHIGEDAMSEGVGRMWAVTRLCIHLTPEDNSRKNLSHGTTAVPSWKVLGTIRCAAASAGLLILVTLS